MKECCEKLKEYAPLFLRIGLGAVFMYHGYGKIFKEGVGLGSAWNPSGMSAILQILVSWGEFIGGAAILLGFLTELASLGIIIIMLGAIFTIHGKNGFGMVNGGFEYNFVLITMCLTLIGIGPGPFSIGCKCCKKE